MTSITSHHHHEGTVDVFGAASAHVRDRMGNIVKPGVPLFTTRPKGDVDLFDLYLNTLPESERQYHNCSCCKAFIRKYGSLVTIEEDGTVKSAVWSRFANHNPAAITYENAFVALRDAVEKSTISGVFVSDDSEWGTATSGGFDHFHFKPDGWCLNRNFHERAHQVVALRKHEYGTLSRGLADYSIDLVKSAINILESGSVTRSEKVVGPAMFLYDLHKALVANPRRKSNLIWRAVATAPAGFAYPRSSMIGTLLDDLAAGLSFDDVRSRFAEKMNPLQYQRPQATPSAGNIAQAEKLVEQLGIAASLKRRYARVEELRSIWRPKPIGEPVPSSGGVFADLLKDSRKGSTAPVAQVGAISWRKFAETVVPNALRMQLRVSVGLSSFCGLLTAVDADAPPILQWDHDGDRNPLSWYLYARGSYPGDWGLAAGNLADITSVSPKPSMYIDGAISNHSIGYILSLSGCVDQRGSGLGLFPEILKSELHSVRSTIEAFSNRGKAEGREEGTANGLMIEQNALKPGKTVPIRVTTEFGVTDYNITHFD